MVKLLLTLCCLMLLPLPGIAAERSRRDDAVFRAYLVQRALRQRQNTQPLESPFQVGPPNRSAPPPPGSNSVVVPNR